MSLVQSYCVTTITLLIFSLSLTLCGDAQEEKGFWRNYLRKLVINPNKQQSSCHFQFPQTMGRCWKHYMKNKEDWNF